MDSSRSRQQRRQGFRQPLDRRVDQLIETGRQFVDGVSGTRPGMRKMNSTSFTGSSLQKVGRWVGDKLEWFLEDEDGWMEPWQSDSQMTNSSGKKPLEAISRRVPKQIKPSDQDVQTNFDGDEWPDDSSFRVDRWKRSQMKENVEFGRPSKSGNEENRVERRPLPRSSRRR